MATPTTPFSLYRVFLPSFLASASFRWVQVLNWIGLDFIGLKIDRERSVLSFGSFRILFPFFSKINFNDWNPDSRNFIKANGFYEALRFCFINFTEFFFQSSLF